MFYGKLKAHVVENPLGYFWFEFYQNRKGNSLLKDLNQFFKGHDKSITI